MFGHHSRDYSEMDERLVRLAAAAEEREEQLRELTGIIQALDLPPRIPLRRPPVEALVTLREHAERAVRGELTDRRLGYGRRAGDFK